MTSTSHDDAAQALAASEDWEGLVDHLHARITSGDPGYHDLATQRAKLLEDKLGKKREAADTLEWLLAKSPRDEALRHNLERLRAETQDWQGLITAYRFGLQVTEDVAAKNALLEKVFRVQRDAMADVVASRATLVELLALDPSSESAWTRLEESHAEDESWWELITGLTKAAMGAGDKAGPITLHIATVMDERLEQIERAIALYEGALEAGANALAALEGLEALYAETEQWDKLAHTYERLLPLALDREERTTLRRNWAMVLSDGLGDISGAIAMYDALLEDDPDDKEAFQAMMALQKAKG